MPPVIAEYAEAAVKVGAVAVDNTAFPVTLLLLVAMFLLVQHQLDRRDPKLALAPIDAEPDLPFGDTRPTGD